MKRPALIICAVVFLSYFECEYTQGEDAKPLKPLRTIHLGIENVGTTVAGSLHGRLVFITQGYVVRDGERHAALECVDANGNLVWRTVDPEPGNHCGEYIQWFDVPEIGQPAVLWTFFPNPKGGDGLNNRGGLFSAQNGEILHRFETGSNNPSFIADLDGDGTNELIYCTQRFVSRFNLLEKKFDWTCRDSVFFCWSHPTVADLNGDNTLDVIWGSEYNLPDGKTSSMIAVDHKGTLLWRSDGHDEDLGSTPVFVADVDGDGKKELVKNGLDLCGKNHLETNHLFVFDFAGKLIRRIPSMMYSTGLADLDHDGHIEAFGVVSRRDGGAAARSLNQLRCVDLATGECKWVVNVSRIGLPASNALAADVDGDGVLEAILADGNPVFYGRIKDEDWGAVYLVRSDGQLLQTLDFKGWPRRLSMFDVNHDGSNELIVQVDGRPASLHIFTTDAPATEDDWPLPFGGIRNWGYEHCDSAGQPDSN